MSKEDLKNIIYEVLISYITERVIEKIAMYNKKVLVVFTGSLINFSEAMENLKKLKEDDFVFEVFFSESARSLLDLGKINEILQPEVIYDDDKVLPESLAKEFDNVIVPTMTINTASKIANCMADTPASRLILNSIMRGKNVIIGVDGCCPDNKERVVLGYKMKEPLKAQLRENMKKIASYGAYLTTLDTLCENTRKRMLCTGLEHDDINRNNVVKNVNSEIKVLSKKVIGNVDILSNMNCKVIKIGKDALVTKLAEEAAQKNKIQLIRE